MSKDLAFKEEEIKWNFDLTLTFKGNRAKT